MAKLSVVFTDDPVEPGNYTMTLEFDPPITGADLVNVKANDLSPAQRVGIQFFDAMREAAQEQGQEIDAEFE